MKIDKHLEINESLAKTRKAIVSFGCSFVEGQGAIDQTLLEEYTWTTPGIGRSMVPKFKNKKQRSKFIARYPDILAGSPEQAEVYEMQYRNSFVSVLCRDFFKGEYTPINFGQGGRGNRASISNLFLHPEIQWDLAEEVIAIWLPSGPERFDFINDSDTEHFKFSCMWPNPNLGGNTPRSRLWKSYFETLYSNKFIYLESILNAGNLVNWCNAQKNVRLIVYPAFNSYSKETFQEALYTNVERDMEGRLLREIHNAYVGDSKKHLDNLIDSWPWECMWHPENTRSWIDLVMSYETECKENYWTYHGKGTPNYWLTACCHPSAKAHRDLAERLHKHITETQ